MSSERRDTGVAPAGTHHWYSLYGLRVQSDVALPAAVPLAEAQHSTPDVVFRRVDSGVPPAPAGPPVASIECLVHGTEMIEYRGPDGTWIWLQSIGTFHVTPDLREVECYPLDGVEELTLALALTGPLVLFVRHQLGYPSLHASAIATERGAVAFLGRRGRGKSTMAASFVRCGSALLTDDALPLLVRPDGIYGVPGPPFMKVWNETARHTLGVSDELPNLAETVDKKLLALQGRYETATSPLPLHRIYVLDRYEPEATAGTDTSVRSLSAREGLFVLLAYTSLRDYLLPPDDAAVLPLFALLSSRVGVRVLSYPSGFAHQDAVHEAVLRDLNQ